MTSRLRPYLELACCLPPLSLIILLVLASESIWNPNVRRS